MNYVIDKDSIRLFQADTFDPESILTSGQVFRFGMLENDCWWVATGSEYAIIESLGDKNYIIHTTNPDYFVRYFDLDTDYDAIIKRLNGIEVLRPALDYGRGVRMLKQVLPEVIINFIISANNNIPRIRKSVEKICERFGEKKDWGYAFPSVQSLSVASESDFAEFGCGYRSKYLVDTIARLCTEDILERLANADTATSRSLLLSLKGVGPKVADCILLFGLGKFDVFPVDTWIARVYREDFGGKESNRERIAKWFVEKFAQDSGYCQQYLFYYKRKDIKLK